MNRLFTIILIMAVPVLIFLYMEGVFQTPLADVFDPNKPIIRIGETQLTVELLRTEAERIQGLSGRDSLPPNTGALFIFPDDDYHGIWMREMRMSLDIIWIDNTHKVVHIEKNVHPDSFPTVFEPPVPARYVIEVPSQYTDSFGIEIGDQAEFPDHIIPADLR